jgi:hypothetical protein
VPDLVGGCFVKSQLLKRAGSLADLAPFAVGKASRDTHEYHPPVKIASLVWISGLQLDGPDSIIRKFATKYMSHAPGTDPRGRKSTFRNCPRYVHRYERVEGSKFVPHSARETPLAPWKRVDDVQSFLSAKDRARVEREGGLISREEYETYINHAKR